MKYDTIKEVSSHYDLIHEVEKFNPYHGADGRFSSAGVATSFTYAPGKSKAHDLAIAREKERHEKENNPYGFKVKAGNQSPQDDAKNTNPNYKPNSFAYAENCQRCVPAYEMRRRGYDVVAKPALKGDDIVGNMWHSIFKGQAFRQCYEGTGQAEVEANMAKWGDGARAEVLITWKGCSRSAHVFVAEQIKGKTHYFDPQDGNTDCSSYFKRARVGRTEVARIDHLEPNPRWITGCCE